jgi:hypothetical protein
MSDGTTYVWAVLWGGFEVEIAGVWDDEAAARAECLRRNRRDKAEAAAVLWATNPIRGACWTVERWRVYGPTDVVGDGNVFEGGNP